MGEAAGDARPEYSRQLLDASRLDQGCVVQRVVLGELGVIEERGTIDRTIDRLRKLRSEVDGYDATGLVLAEWKDHPDLGLSAFGTSRSHPTVKSAPFSEQWLTV